MSIMTEERATVIPAGGWHLDPVWSSLEFEVRDDEYGSRLLCLSEGGSDTCYKREN